MKKSARENSIRVPVRTEEELSKMRKGGEIAARAMKKVLASVKPGVSLVELDKIAEEEIKRLGGESSFKSVPGYKYTTCLTVNEEVVHGLPRDIKLAEGDVLGVDLGALYQGWHTDMAWTVLVQNQESRIPPEARLAKGGKNQEWEERERFIRVGEETLWKTLKQARNGKRIGDISSSIQSGVESAGYAVVKSLAGHGVGRRNHEEPEIPEYGTKGTGLKLHAGMTLAIEVIFTAGRGELIEKADGWTLAAADGSLGGLFEMTVIVTRGEPEILTDWRKV